MRSHRNNARRWPGIELRHSRSCARLSDGRCDCQPTYRAWVYSKRDGKKIRKTFPTLSAAKGWRADMTSAANRRALRAPVKTTLREAADALFEGMHSGAITARGGRPYKPSTIRQYEGSLKLHVLGDLGAVRLADITSTDLQDLVERLRKDGASPSTIHNATTPLQVIFRRAVRRGELTLNPALDLDRPAVTAQRDRAATAEEAAELVAALPEGDRALYATAFYAGVRRGELMALRWEDVDLAKGIIRIERSWDVKAGIVEPKSRKGKRTVPVVPQLRDHLLEHKLLTERSDGYVFGTTATRPFSPSAIRKRVSKAWDDANEERAKAEKPSLRPIGLHECRHTFVSLMHAAGESLETIGDYVGHTSTYMTDRYRHLLEGHEAETAKRFGDYLALTDTRARLAQVEAA